MKKKYIAPTLHSMELGSETICLDATSGRTTSGFQSSKNENEAAPTESIWNGSWNEADED